MQKQILEGRLLSYSEQGMEGGILCFQDVTYIKLGEISSPFGIHENQKVWDKKNTNRVGTILAVEILRGNHWLEDIDPMTKDEDYKLSSLYHGESRGDLEADKRLSKKYNFRLKYSVERLNEAYGIGNWKIDKQLPDVILKDGTEVHFGDTPTITPERPYGIPADAKTRVTVHWHDGVTEHHKSTEDLLREVWDYKGLLHLLETDYIKVFEPDSNVIINEGKVSDIPLKLFSDTYQGHFEQIRDGRTEWEKYFLKSYRSQLYREAGNDLGVSMF